MDRVDESVINYDLIEDVLYLILVSDSNDVLKPPAEYGVDKYCDGGAVLIFLPVRAIVLV